MGFKKVRAMMGAAAVAMATAAVIAGPVGTGSASAAGPCWYSGSHWWCNNVSGAKVYGFREDTARNYPDRNRTVGRMFSNPSWFQCRFDGSPDNGNGDTYWVGGPHPYRWIWTMADNHEWGWMKDTDISSETQTLPPCW
ncbi:hypothetical protein [Streptosporangium sp. NPDC051022]|uniref:hypothetical protein n=1 Tax=Streptosporangium sp. NPDC051022 TaxID=3155752 RepID=UPI0034375406